MKKILLTIILFSFMIIPFISAIETTPISYIQKVDYTPYCGTTCTNNTAYNSTSNITTVTNNCQTGCHAVFNISLMFAGDEEFRSIQINTSSPLYQNGSDFIIPGVYMASLGNRSDVTGINEKILNLTAIINNKLADCYSDNLALEANRSRDNMACTVEKDSLNSAISQRNNTITEYEKYKNQRWWFGIGGIVLGFIIIKWFLPYTKEHLPKRDPIEGQHSPYLGQH
jgi:hypothetical protein